MNVKSRQSDIVVQEAGNEILIYDLRSHRTLFLNETAAIVWRSLDGATDIKSVAFELSRKTKSEPNEEIVWLTIDSLGKEDLLENAKLPSPVSGLNRRNAVKRIGMATMIALPLITSVVAPNAANAASNGACVGLQAGFCVDNGDFSQSNCCTGLRCVFDECLQCRTSAGLPYVQQNSLAACEASTSRNFCCNPANPVTFVPANPPFSTVGSCFCG